MEPYSQYTFEFNGKKKMEGLYLLPVKSSSSAANLKEA